MKTVLIASGGIDSTVLAHWLANQGHDLHLLSFDYGQKHKKEIGFAEILAGKVGGDFDVFDLSGVGSILKSALTNSDIDVPTGDYDKNNMRLTVVPNRNAIMLSIAFGVAVTNGAERVAIGVHSGDHFIYPDCRPRFINAFDIMQSFAIEGLGNGVGLIAPFVRKEKKDIVLIGDRLGVSFENTWSCYIGGDVHCGSCGTCVERRRAFVLAGINDPTEYKDEG